MVICNYGPGNKRHPKYGYWFGPELDKRIANFETELKWLKALREHQREIDKLLEEERN